MSRLVAFLVVALLIFFIISQPETAADPPKAIGATLVSRVRGGHDVLRGAGVAAV